MSHVPRSTWVFLAVGLVALSQSGNLIRIGDAAPAAIAFWRLTMAGLVLAILAGPRLRELRGLDRTDRVLLAAAGVLLAGHLVAWIAAVQHTRVANASLLFGVNPVLTAGAAYLFFGERVSLRLGLSALLGLAGLVTIALEDLDLTAGSLAGDGYALLCAALFSAYFLLGKRLRRKLDVRTYVAALYLAAGAACLPVLLVLDLPLIGYSGRNWLCFGLMALIPTLVGHTSLNHALRYLDASFLSVATLAEPALAGFVAWWAWGEAVTPAMIAGYGFITASVVVLVRQART